MARVMAVSFQRYGRLHYLDPGEATYRVGDRVLVPTEAGPEVAECVWAPEFVADDEGFADLPRCAGMATAAHLERDEANRRHRAETKLVAKRLIRRHDLPMKVVGVDHLDGSPASEQVVVVYFTAPHRVDFRALVGDLARALRARIDLRQIGSREAAKITGGLGTCGRELCCATFLSDFEPVTLRMARAQDLPPNPLKISGACGRLMCCLKYEHPLYADFARTTPAVGAVVETPDGPATVVAHAVPADEVVVRMSATGTVSRCSRAGVCGSRAAYASRGADAPEEPTVAAAEVEPGADADPEPSEEPTPERRKQRWRRRR